MVCQLSNNRMHALRVFYCHLGTFSRRGAVALATIYPCAECASSRSIFIVWKRSFLYDKKGTNLFSDSSLSNRVLFSPDTAHIAYWLLYSVA